MTREEMIEKLNEVCGRTDCKECVRYKGVLTDSRTDCYFKNFTDEELTRAYKKMVMNIIEAPEIKDSGARTVFYNEDGKALGHRDIQEDKGRMDLVPLGVVADLLEFNGTHPYANVLRFINCYIETKHKTFLQTAIIDFCRAENMKLIDVILDVSIHYRDGARKYQENNWKNGLPLKSYLSSGCRHLLRYINNEKDEAHNRGFVWNMLGALWTIDNMPEMIDCPFEGKQEGDE